MTDENSRLRVVRPEEGQPACGGVGAAGDTPPGKQAVTPVWEIQESRRSFRGRDAELRAISRHHQDKVGLILVTGHAGSGKSELVRRWAYENVLAFPGGQYFADMGADPDDGPQTSSTVVARWSVMLGAKAGEVPDDASDLFDMFERLATGRRALFFLDDVTTRRQVELIRTGGAPNLVIATTSRQLTGSLGVEPFRRLSVNRVPSRW